METSKLYIPVTDLVKGDTIVNLGIIKHIFVNTSLKRIILHFHPSRDVNTHPKTYHFSDKLMKA